MEHWETSHRGWIPIRKDGVIEGMSSVNGDVWEVNCWAGGLADDAAINDTLDNYELAEVELVVIRTRPMLDALVEDGDLDWLQRRADEKRDFINEEVARIGRDNKATIQWRNELAKLEAIIAKVKARRRR